MRAAAFQVVTGRLGGRKFDYYVNGTTGNDANAGTQSAPFATMTQLRTVIGALPANSVKRAYIAPMTYTNQDLDVVFANDGCVVTVVMPAGTILERNDAFTGNAIQAETGASTLIVIGDKSNRPIVRGFATGDGNGLGQAGSSTIYCYGVRFENCVDGASAHGALGGLYSYDNEFVAMSKGGVAHVHTGACVVEHHRDYISCVSTPVNGIVGTFGEPTTPTLFESCVADPPVVGLRLTMQSASWIGGRIGSTTLSVNLDHQSNSTANAVIQDAYVHAYAEGNTSLLLTRCFGRFSARQNSGANLGIRIRNCIFAAGVIGGPAIGTPSSVYFNGYDFGGGSHFSIRSSIVSGMSVGVGGSFNSTFANYFKATTPAGFESYCSFWSNSTNVHASLIAASADVSTGNITTDPKLGPCNTYAQADWAVLPSSPCIGAGYGGEVIGF